MTTPAAWDRMVKSHPQRMAHNAAHYSQPHQGEIYAALDRARRCRRCGRKLKDEASVAAKLGPECRAYAVAR